MISTEMEEKLAEYRLKKEREARINNIKSKFTTLGNLLKRSDNKIDEVSTSPPAKPESDVPLLSDTDQDDSLLLNTTETSPNSDDEEEKITCCSYLDLVYYVLLFALWCVVYSIFIKVQFGTVFLIVSALAFMYANTRTGPKKNNEVSAYSVFNKNCKSIDGTLKAEQFEREIRYGSGAVR